MSGALRIERVAGLASLRQLRSDWEHLATRATAPPPCNEPAWVLAYLESLGAPEHCFVLAVRDPAQALVACLPLTLEPARSRWALRRLRHAADGSFDSEMLAPLIAAGEEARVAPLLLEALTRERRAHALLLFAAPLANPALAALQREAHRRGWPQRCTALTYLCAPLAEDWKSTLLGLKPRMRSKVRAALRSIDERGLCARRVRDPVHVEQALEALFDLHQRRWRAEGRPGSFAEPRRKSFYRALAREYLPAGRLWLALLEREGRPIAAQFGVQSALTYTQIQEGYAPEEAAWRPGTALRAWVLEQCVAQGVRQCDFQEGEAAHKRDWGGSEVPCGHLVLGLPRWRTRLEFALRRRLRR